MTIGIRKKGRSASDIERETALGIVQLYRDAQASPDGKLWATINAENLEERHMYVDSTDVEPLLEVLENFSATGYFNGHDEEFRLLKLIELRNQYLNKRKRFSSEHAIEELARQHGSSTKTIERRLAEANKLATKNRK